jgi:hypothetical protein
MSPEYSKLFEFSGALLVAMGAMSWWRQDTEEEDAAVIAANDLVLESLSNADATRTVACVTDRNWRDDVTVAEAEALRTDSERRKWGGRRN